MKDKETSDRCHQGYGLASRLEEEHGNTKGTKNTIMNMILTFGLPHRAMKMVSRFAIVAIPDGKDV